MSLIKWTPIRSSLTPYSNGSLGDNIDTLFDSFFGRRLNDTSIQLKKRTPVFDVTENDKEYTIHVETPGMDKTELHVTVKEGVLTISGEKKTKQSTKQGNYIQMESAYGHFSRSFYLADDINEKKIKADYQNGVLIISVPKKKNANSKQYEVAIN